jgi:hypothetical protein
MSKFLAPIHGWLFNKILLLEDIEKEIVKSFNNETLRAAHTKAAETLGGFLPNEPLENLIDQSNIHGWLQKTITTAESRQAAFVKAVIEEDIKNVDTIKAIYEAKGKDVAKQMGIIESAKDAFSSLNNVLLEGMPCDRVNVVVEDTEHKFVWKTQQCVHKANWETNGVEVEYYYRFREAFTKGFVTEFNVLNYNYEIEGQVHTIEKA